MNPLRSEEWTVCLRLSHVCLAGVCLALSSAVGLSGYVAWGHWVVGLVICSTIACVLAIILRKPGLLLCAVAFLMPPSFLDVPARPLGFGQDDVPLHEIIHDPLFECWDNRSAISIALQRYQEKHGHLPPAYTVEDSGRRMHSWRVLLLPYLGYDELYSRYRLDEPWDGPNNRLLWDEPAAVYQCPLDSTAAATGATSYLAVVGESAVWSGSMPSKAPFLFPVRPGRLLVVELLESGVRWSEPRDISADDDPSPDLPLAGVLEARHHQLGSQTITAPTAGAESIDERWTIEELQAWVRGDIVKQLRYQRERRNAMGVRASKEPKPCRVWESPFGARQIAPPSHTQEYERESGPLSDCVANLDAIANALMAYQAEHGHLPPTHIADESGQRMHSWRVLILPYLGYEELYNRYRFDEPWNGPHNRLLWGEEVEVYQCPKDREAVPAGFTSYLAVVGERALWSGPTPHAVLPPRGLRPWRLLVVEIANSGVRWSEPRDLSADADHGLDVSRDGVLRSGNHLGGLGLNQAITVPFLGIEQIMNDWTIEELDAWIEGDGAKQDYHRAKRIGAMR